MSRLQTIESQLKTINGAKFQELCDSYLTRRYKNHSGFSRVGSQIGKQKTTRGTPDSFFILPNGNYVFVETTTDISTKDKLSKDILACFDFKKTKIPINKVEEIVLCINWNINQTEILKLNKLVKRHNNNVILSFVMLQELAIELHLNHRDLTHIYLGLPLDTGQIVLIENFITEYDRASKGIATPLNNIFLHRSTELEQLSTSIDNYDFIILTGAPGVGKTKLAIETIKKYLVNNNSYQAYCVSYKSHTLIDDLNQYFDVDKDYLLFVDDANRIAEIEQITGFFKGNRKGKLKIVITVRDYAFQEIDHICQEFLSDRMNINKLTDEQIIDIIKSEPFEILNSNYYDKIVQISDGNPRLAIMISLYAKQVNNLDALNDVSDLFEKYFSTFIKDDGEFENPLNIKCLGIISFFYTIPYKDKEVTESILEKFEISYNDFIDTIDKLDKLELAEIQFEHVKIPEQNLATFFFYKVFIKDNLLSFQILLNNYFENYKNRFTDSIIPANNTFGPENVMDKIKPELVHYSNLIKNTQKSSGFLKLFWFYLQDQTLEFIYEYIETLPEIEENTYTTTYEMNQFAYNRNDIIELAGNFFRFNNNYLKDSIELLFKYITRQPEKLPELIHKIRESLIFDRDDEQYGFYRQNTLFDILIDGVNRVSELITASFYELAKTFISHSFQQFKGGRNNNFIHYQYQIPDNKNIKEFRIKIWDTLDTNFLSHPELSFELLRSYSEFYRDVNTKIMKSDIPFILNIIDKHLNVENFEHCKYVQDQIKCLKQYNFDLERFKTFKNRFVNNTYNVFLKIDWDRFRDKEMFEFENHDEYNRLKEDEIRSSFVFNNINDVNNFYSTFLFLKKTVENNYRYNESLDFIIDENFSRDFEMGINLLNKVIEGCNEINYIPNTVFRNQLKTDIKVNRILEIIQLKEFDLKESWKLSFFDFINDSLINKKFSNSLIDTIKGMNISTTIYFDRLDRFLLVEPNLFQIILKIITEKNEKENTRLQVSGDLFSKYFITIGKDIELIKRAYIQQNLIQVRFDYQGKGILKILKNDKNFLIEFIDSLYLESDKRTHSRNDINYIWNINDIENILISVFDLVIRKDLYFGIKEHFCNAFFKSLKEEHKDRANNFIKEYVISNNKNHSKMQVIADIIRHSRKEIFEEIFKLYITLNQDKEDFSKLQWRDSVSTYSGNVNIGDIKASEWNNLLSIVTKLNLGIKSLPIKMYLKKHVVDCLIDAKSERKRKFLRSGN